MCQLTTIKDIKKIWEKQTINNFHFFVCQSKWLKFGFLFFKKQQKFGKILGQSVTVKTYMEWIQLAKYCIWCAYQQNRLSYFEWKKWPCTWNEMNHGFHFFDFTPILSSLTNGYLFSLSRHLFFLKTNSISEIIGPKSTAVVVR